MINIRAKRIIAFRRRTRFAFKGKGLVALQGWPLSDFDKQITAFEGRFETQLNEMARGCVPPAMYCSAWLILLLNHKIIMDELELEAVAEGECHADHEHDLDLVPKVGVRKRKAEYQEIGIGRAIF